MDKKIMRIVAGSNRGKKISYPEGQTTRPTRDSVRESVFNILEHASWSDGIKEAKVIDLFSGTGALGLEAVSRGAAEVIFIEQDREAISCCEKNIADMKLETRSKLLKRNVIDLHKRDVAIERRNLVFLDPPYKKNLGNQGLNSLITGDWMEKGAIVVFEMAKASPEEILPDFELLDERVYGIAMIRFLKFKGI